MKFKKMLSALTAMAIAASCFVGTVANAAEHTYSVPAADTALAAGDVIFENDDIKVYVNAAVTTAATTDSNFDGENYPYNIPLRASGKVSKHVDDVYGNVKEGSASIIIEPVTDGSFTGVVSINAGKSFQIWDNTADSEIAKVSTTEKATQTITADLTGGSQYILWVNGTSSSFNGFTYTVEDAGETPVEPEETEAPAATKVDVAAIINNGTGTLLTAEEQVQGTEVSFGVAADGTRVAADSADAVMIISGNYHSDHGMTNMVATVNVSGPALITVGSCTYGNDAVVKDADGNEVATVKTVKACWKNNTENVGSAYYKGEATTLTISNGGYVPYVSVKEVDASEIPNDVTATFDISAYVCDGTAPADITVDMGEAITIPANTSLYSEGMTLVGWTDGSIIYEIGENITLTEDVTLTPWFEENTVALGDADATINFTLERGKGAATYASEGGSAVIVGQADINGEKIDVKVDVDTTNGKLANANWTDWAQVNGGTKFIVPVVKGSVITMGTIMGQDGVYTIGGESFAVSTGGSYTATADGTVEIIAGEPSGSYWRGFTVTYPKKAESKIDSLVELVKKYDTSEEYEGVATALKATFTITGEASFNHVAFTVSGVTAEDDVTVVSGDGTSAVYGIIVENAIIEAADVTAVASMAE